MLNMLSFLNKDITIIIIIIIIIPTHMSNLEVKVTDLATIIMFKFLVKVVIFEYFIVFAESTLIHL